MKGLPFLSKIVYKRVQGLLHYAIFLATCLAILLRHKLHESIDIKGEIENDQNVVAEELSQYFSTVADDIGGSNTLSFTEDDFSNHPSVVNIANNFTSTEKFSSCSITKTETVKALESLNRNKSMGRDMISLKLLSMGAKELAPSLTNIFNLAINSGEYPSSWKKGEWIPVYKKNERTDKKNYRPITVLSIVNQIF